MPLSVDKKHKEYTLFETRWKRCRDVCAGEHDVHLAGEAYLPKLKDQITDEYNAYVMRAPFFNATWRTISGLLGMMFRKQPKLEVPDDIMELLKDVDQSGTPFFLFAQNLSEEALTLGRVGVLVDFPLVDENATQADALKLNLRPRMNMYQAETILNWRTSVIDNKKQLTFVVLQECEDKVESEFETKETEQFRVLDLDDEGYYRQRIFTKTGLDTKNQMVFAQQGGDIYPKMNNEKMKFVPFKIIGTDSVDECVDTPPLMDLVDMNLSHYRVSADYEHGCHFTGLPTLFLAGVQLANENEKIYIGSTSAIVTSNSDAKASFVEFSGQGLQALEKNLDRKEAQMAVLGSRMLDKQRAQVQSAESQATQRKGEESLLASICISISISVEQVLKWFIEWHGLDAQKVEFDVNRDFFPQPMTPMMLTALVNGWQTGAFSDQTLFDNLKAGEIISTDTTLEEEQSRTVERQPTLVAPTKNVPPA